MDNFKFVNTDNFFVIQGWMRSELNLSGNALLIYAIIYGFSQTAHQEFTASINYLVEWVGCSRRTVFYALDELIEKGLITKESEEKGGVIYNRYRAIRGGAKIAQGSAEFAQGGAKIAPNNIDNNKEIRKSEKDKSFSEGQAPDKVSKSFSDIFSDPQNENIKDALRKFVNYCRGINYRISKANVEKAAETLRVESKNNPRLAMLLVDHAIKKNWKMIYPIKGGEINNEILQGIVSEPDTDDVARDENGNPIVFE